MSKKQHIDNISDKLWKDYFSGVILTSDKERVEYFLQQYPEFESDFKAVFKEDIASVNRVSKNVNSKIDIKIGKKNTPIIWWSTAVILIATSLVAYNFIETSKEEQISNKNSEEIVQPDRNSEKQIAEIIEEKQIDDTIFSFEIKGGKVDVNEFVQEVVKEETEIAKTIEDNELEKQGLASLEEVYKENETKIEILSKKFAISVDYRQTLYVEDNFYSQSKTVGKTTSYASSIKGYSYNPEGMPSFNGNDDNLLEYINLKLKEDDLLVGTKKKMKANLSFVVTNKGKMKDVLVQNCNNRQLGLSLMNIMEMMPDWSPSQFKGKKGKAHYVLKIVFE